MIDIVITYDRNINTENRLRLLLRAIENECEGFNEIVLVGDKPDWIQGVIYLPFSDTESKKFHQKNLFRKLKAVCLKKNVTENFYWIDADFVVPKFNAAKAMRISVDEDVFKYSHSGTEKIMFTHTFNLMKRRGFYNSGSFFNKFPMSMNKKKLMNTFDDVDFETQYGYCIKTLYVNFNRLNQTSGYIHPIDLTKFEEPSTYENSL